MSRPAARTALGLGPAVRFGLAALLVLLALAAGQWALRVERRGVRERARAAGGAWWATLAAELRTRTDAPGLPLPPAADAPAEAWQHWVEQVALARGAALGRVHDPAGRVRASAHWPASRGARLPLPAGPEIVLAEEPLATGSRRVALAGRPVPERPGFRLVLGRELPSGGPYRIVPGEAPERGLGLPGVDGAAWSLRAAAGLSRGVPIIGWPLLPPLLAGLLAAGLLLWATGQPHRRQAALERWIAQRLPALTPREPLATVGAWHRWLKHLARRQHALERRLRRVRRLAGWRSTGRALAHEVRNALTPVRASLELAERHPPPTPAAGAATEKRLGTVALESLASAEALLDEFSDFARLPEGSLQSVDLAVWVPAVVRRWAPDRAIECTHAPGRFRARIDPARVERAVGNLLRNALEAAAGRTVRVHLAALPPPAGTEAARWVRVTVFNEGAPIPPPLGARLFAEGTSTKPSGAGLGLAIARGIARQTGGRLTYRNVTAGVAFDLTLPMRTAPGAPHASAGPASGRMP